jgi:hypothetical protein
VFSPATFFVFFVSMDSTETMVVNDPDDDEEGVKEAASFVSESSSTALSVYSHKTPAEGWLRALSETTMYRTYDDIMNDMLRELEHEDRILHARRWKPNHG